MADCCRSPTRRRTSFQHSGWQDPEPYLRRLCGTGENYTTEELVPRKAEQSVPSWSLSQADAEEKLNFSFMICISRYRRIYYRLNLLSLSLCDRIIMLLLLCVKHLFNITLIPLNKLF